MRLTRDGVAVLRRLLLRPAPATGSRERARALAAMFFMGAVIAFVSVPFAGDRPMRTVPIVVNAALGIPGGLLLVRFGDRFPRWMFHPFLAAGTLLVAVACWLAGAGTTPVAWGTLLLWVALYSGFFFSLLGAVLHGVLAIAAMAVVLTRLHQPAALELITLGGVGAVLAGVSHWLSHLRALSELDPLTGVANRRGLSRRLEVAMDEATVTNAPLAVALLDLDHFKRVNDRHGHDVGDRLLVECVQEWRAQLPASTSLARHGGDEFVVLLPGHGLIQAREVVDRLRRSAPAGHTCSAGVAMWAYGDTQSMLVARADTALYDAKHLGRDRVRVVGDDSDMVAELWNALDDGQFVLHYQPIRTLADDRLTGVEALVRWRHPERGLLAPGAFIDLAEACGAIHSLGRWVIDEACRQLEVWRAAVPGAQDLGVSLNLSVTQLARPQLLDDLAHALDRRSLPPDALTLELTEGIFQGDTERAATVLWDLRRLGVRLAMDDFGTGHSSLARLRDLPFDVLKIDRSFVVTEREGGHEALLAGIVGIARGLGLETVAEGIEAPEQLALVRAQGCTRAQGFLLGRPVPADELWAALTTTRPSGADDADRGAGRLSRLTEDGSTGRRESTGPAGPAAGRSYPTRRVRL